MLSSILNKKIYMVFLLLLLSLIASTLLAYTYDKTASRIELEYRNDFIRALNIVLPEYNNDPYNDIQVIDNRTIYLAKDHDSNIIAYAVGASSDKGYSGKISVVVGVDISGKLTGVYVVKHSETPGLGSHIEDESFLSKYIGLFESKDIMIIKDGGTIATMSGATISPRAVSLAVIDALEFIKKSVLEKGAL